MVETSRSRKVVVFGLGYVGCVTAACLSSLGHSVTGVDVDQGKVDAISARRAPFFEPELDQLVEKGVQSGLLRATTDTGEALQEAEIALVCVGTPSERNGNLGMGQLRRVTEDIAKHTGGRTKKLVVAIRSTVFPGTCEEVVMPLLADRPAITVVSNPEFLREGCAVRDFQNPSLSVVGGLDASSVADVADLYTALGVESCLVSLRTAEMIKYACNAFHAVKISFANEIGALASQLGVDGREVMDTLCQDVRLNISPAYLKPGFAFGGSCLPKDLRALTYRSARLDLKLPFLESVLPSNTAHLNRSIQAVMEVSDKRIGVMGLAFKEDTDDLRESPVITLLEFLIGKGRNVRVFDPHVRMESIYGSNRSFLLDAIPHIGRLLEDRAETLLDWAEVIVVAQKPSREIAERIAASGRPVIDLVGTDIARKSHA